MSRIIEIIVASNGSSRIETKGFNGSECQSASRLIEQALGRSTDEQLTPEFYARTDTQQSVQQNSG